MSDSDRYINERRTSFLLGQPYKRGDGTLTVREIVEWTLERDESSLGALMHPFVDPESIVRITVVTREPDR